MARITIIPDDGTVYLDNVTFQVDLSGCGIPADVHALQWFDTAGWVEYRDNLLEGTRPPNSNINELPAWVAPSMQKWDEAKAADDALKAQRMAEKLARDAAALAAGGAA